MNIIRKPLILLAIVSAIITSCSEETEQVAPDLPSEVPVQEEEMIASAPFTVDTFISSNEEEVIDDLPFLKKESSTSNARMYAAGVTDYVDFNDKMALTIVPDYAVNTFATAPYYIQQVGNAWVHVKENNGAGYNPAFTSAYNHYHLSYQNFTPCIKSNGQFGKPSGSNCVSFSPTDEPRTLNTHVWNQWIKIYAYDYSSPKRVFDLQSIKVTKGPIQLWFKKKTGGWQRWKSLGVGTWNTSAYSTEITEVLIAGSNSSSGSIGFDNVKIKMPYY